MFRTRDFLLLFTAIVFLMVAIGTTSMSKRTTSPEAVDAALQPAPITEGGYSASVSESTSLSREARLAAMRQKVTESESLVLAAAVATETLDENYSVDSVNQTNSVTDSPLTACPPPVTHTGAWPRGVVFELREGARVLYTESTIMQPTVGTSAPQAELTQTIVLQLPVPFGPAANPTCPASDVVGVAQDGSLIRNFETGLYSVFGENTLIGYALDGFPIYGVSSVQTDKCGGAVVGTYRYYLSDSRESIINCYAGTPVKL